MVQVPDFSDMHENDAQAELTANSLNGDFHGLTNFNPDVDVVKLQLPAPGTEVEPQSTVQLYMSTSSVSVSDLRNTIFPHVEHYLPHGEDPIFAQLAIKSSKPLVLELKASRNVSIRVLPLLERNPALDRKPIATREAGVGKVTPKDGRANTAPI